MYFANAGSLSMIVVPGTTRARTTSQLLDGRARPSMKKIIFQTEYNLNAGT